VGGKRVINGVHVVPMGRANAFLIECDDGLTLIDAGFPGKEATVFQGFAGLAVRQASSLPMPIRGPLLIRSVSGNTC